MKQLLSPSLWKILLKIGALASVMLAVMYTFIYVCIDAFKIFIN
ncbi:MAG TPA: hypothetical protein VFN30_15570 [Chitinophagaceae bacterium]|nr:hypothetical protein [Chitinophagaceae bacterium]